MATLRSIDSVRCVLGKLTFIAQQRASLPGSWPRAGISSLGKKGVDQLSLGSRPNILMTTIGFIL